MKKLPRPQFRRKQEEENEKLRHKQVLFIMLCFVTIIISTTLANTKATKKNSAKTSNKKAARELRCQSSADCAKDCSYSCGSCKISTGPQTDGISEDSTNKAELELRCQFSGNCTNDCFDSCGVCKMSYCETHLNSHNCGQRKSGTTTDMTTKTPGKPVKKGTRNHLIDRCIKCLKFIYHWFFRYA